MSAKRKSPAPRKKRIFLADADPMMRESLRQLMETQSDLEVCDEAEDATRVIAKIAKTAPDLAIVDITLHPSNSLELIQDLQVGFPNIPVLVLSMHDETLYAERVLRAGGRGYVMKQEGGEKILEAIRHILSGQTYVSPRISAKIMEGFSGRPVRTTSPVEKLTDREFQVFELIGSGLATREIAGKLRLSVKTIEVHRVNIKQKLNIRTAPELILFAVRWAKSQSGA